MRSFQKRAAEFEKRGIRIAAISVDPVEINQRQQRKFGAGIQFFSDPKAEVIRQYDLLHAKGGPKGEDIARPGEFLVDPGGTIRWVNLTDSISVRARPEQVLKVFDAGKTN